MGKKFFIKTVLSAASLASLLFVSACQDSGGKSSGQAALIGIAIPETHVARWVKDGNSLKNEVEKRGYRAEVYSANANQPTQNRHIASLLGLGAKLLIVGSIDSTVSTAIAEAAQANVPVIAYDRLIPGSADYDYYITFNNYKVGVLKGQCLAEALGLETASADSPKTIALFAGAPTDGNAFFFYDGAMSVLNPYIEKGVLKVVGPYPKTSEDVENFRKIAVTNWQAEPAREMITALLAGPAKDVVLNAILAPNDFISRTIMEVVRNDPKYANSTPLITGQDAEYDSALEIKRGRQLCTVFKNTTQLAEAAVILADQILKGETPNIPGAVLATGNLAKMGDTGKKVVMTYLLDPILITKDNLDIPINAGFFTDAEVEELRR